MILFDVLVCFFVLLWGYKFQNRFILFNNFDRRLLNKLFLYHILVGVLFFLYIMDSGGDSTNYWFVTYYDNYTFEDIIYKMTANKGSATGYMLLLNYIPAKILGLSFFTGSLIYTVMGFMGFVYMYAIIKENIPEIHLLKRIKIFTIPIFPLLLFLPNLHFWSSGVGKDSLMFFCIMLFIYSVKKIRERFLGICISILLSIFIRPHIVLFLLIAFGIGFTLDKKLFILKKLVIFIVFIIGFVAIFDYVLAFIQLEGLDSLTISNYSTTRASNLSDIRTESSIDISNYSFPLKLFTFLYRPFFIDGLGVLGLIASLENLILLGFSIKVIFNKPIRTFYNSDFFQKGVLVFFILGSFSFAMILGNLGIMLRQKTPFIISLIVFGLVVLINNKKKLYESTSGY